MRTVPQVFEQERPFVRTDPGSPGDVDVSTVARLIGEPARAAMLNALLTGRALTAGELARTAGVSPATASEHLTRLRTGGLVRVLVSGRHRYYRLASSEVAQALEALALIGRARPARGLRQVRAHEAMLIARTCYDHLAGRLGVAVHDALADGGALVVGPDGYDVSADGEEILGRWGVDLAAARSRRRTFIRPCVDFTERRPHLAGALASAVLQRMRELGWLVPRTETHRALRITDAGRHGLAEMFGIDTGRLVPADA